MADKQLVLSFFADEPAADAAAMELKDSGIASGDAIGLLVLDAAGNLKVDKVGARSWGAGAGVGACLVLLGPAVLGVGLIGGTAAGGLHHKGLKLSDEDKTRISADLGAGKAAVGVLAKIEDAPDDPEAADGARRRDLEPRCGRRGGSADGSSGAVGLALRRAASRLREAALRASNSSPGSAFHPIRTMPPHGAQVVMEAFTSAQRRGGRYVR